jgi:hypothetical protein
MPPTCTALSFPPLPLLSHSVSLTCVCLPVPAALLWVLQRLPEMPVWHANADLTAVFKASGIVPARPETVTAFLQAPAGAPLMTEDDVRLERDRAEAWHWRARAQRLIAIDAERARPNAVRALSPNTSTSSPVCTAHAAAYDVSVRLCVLVPLCMCLCVA